MTTEIATLGIEVKTDGVKAGADALDKLTAAGGKADKATAGLTAIFRKIDAAAKTAQSEISQLAASYKQAGSTIEQSFATLKIRNSAAIVADAKAIRVALNDIKANGNFEDIARASAAAKSSLAALRVEMRGVSDSANGAGQEAKNAGTAMSLLGSVATVAGVALVANKIKDVSLAMVEAQKGAQKLKASLEFSSGSDSGAAKEIKYLSTLTRELGLDFGSASNSYARFAASAKGTSITDSTVKATFEGIAKASSQLGLSAGETEGALLALSQMVSKGTVQAEELRGQLGERLPGAFQIAARAMGVTTAELGKMLENGQVVTAEFLPKFAAELNKTYQPVNNLNSEINRLASSFELFKREASEGTNGGSFRWLTNGLNEATAAMKELGSNAGIVHRLLVAIGGFQAGAVGAGKFDTAKLQKEAMAKLAQVSGGISSLESRPNTYLEQESLRDLKRQEAELKASLLSMASQRGKESGISLPGKDRLKSEAAAQFAEMNAPAAAYMKLQEKLNGNSEDYQKNLRILKAEYDRGGISVESYRSQVEKLIQTETKAGKDSVKKPKKPKAAKEDENAGFDLAAAKAYESSISGIAGAQLAAEKSTLSLNGAQTALYDLMRSPEWERMPETWQQIVIAETAAATEAMNAADGIKRLNDMLGATESAGIEKARSDMELLTKALNAGTIGEQQYLEAATARLDLTADKAKEVTSDMDEFAKSAAKNMQSSFADFLFDPFGDGTKSMASNFAKSLQRMAADAASAKLMAAIFGDGKDNKGAISGFDWSKLFSGFSGSTSSSATGLSSLPSGVLQSFDVGTDYVPHDMIAKIHKGERITPAKFNPANGGGNVSVEINNYSGQKVEQKEVQDGRGNRTLQIQIGEAVAAEMLRSGSAANKAMRQPRMVAR